jgi:hypothetical protein
MRLSTRNENVMMIAEDTPRMKSAIKIIHAGYSDRFEPVLTKAKGKKKMFHSNHIIETIHFAPKAASMPLQIADACAFVFKRRVMEKDDSFSFFDVMRPQLFFDPRGDEEEAA